MDSEHLIKQFLANGYKVSHNPEEVSGEIVVINTCGFIADAQEESINMILDIVEYKKTGQVGQVYVMGCLTERFMDDLKVEIPEVDGFYGKFNWKKLISDLGKAYYNDPMGGNRSITTPKHYAYLKISEGCNRTCSYCAIPLITGKYVSRPMEDIVEEAKSLIASGVKEIQLIAQDLTYYGLDLYHEHKLPELVERLASLEGLEWLRLHYAYPNAFPKELFRVIREHNNVCTYIDIALQHISNSMLKSMRRGISKEETYSLLKELREEIPGIHIRTTLMVGHPGETDEDFEELLQFVRDIKFDRLGAFIYSHEDGTYSHQNYEDDIPLDLKQERMNRLMEEQEAIMTSLNQEKIGQTLRTIIDRREGDYYIGRTEFDSPEVDQEVLIKHIDQELVPGEFYQVEITSADVFDLYGKIAK
jgi:ribosomal protein S12 methylthiotransferase rimO